MRAAPTSHSADRISTREEQTSLSSCHQLPRRMQVFLFVGPGDPANWWDKTHNPAGFAVEPSTGRFIVPRWSYDPADAGAPYFALFVLPQIFNANGMADPLLLAQLGQFQEAAVAQLRVDRSVPLATGGAADDSDGGTTSPDNSGGNTTTDDNGSGGGGGSDDSAADDNGSDIVLDDGQVTTPTGAAVATPSPSTSRTPHGTLARAAGMGTGDNTTVASSAQASILAQAAGIVAAAISAALLVMAA